MFFSDEIKAEICMEKVFSVVAIDLDYFIRYIMRLSNPSISELKRKIDTFFEKEFLEDILFYEQDADEYFVVLCGVNCSQAKERIEKILSNFRRERFLKGITSKYEKTRMTFSAGIADSSLHGNDINEIVRKGIVALNQAKAMRRSKVIIAPIHDNAIMSNIVFSYKVKIEIMFGVYGSIGLSTLPAVGADATLWEPQAIAIDSDGKTYIADQNNHRIVMYDGYILTTIAGCGKFGYSGDGGEAKNACLNKPTGLCISNNYLYITDTGNDVVRRVNLRTSIIDTFAGCGKPGYIGDGGEAKLALLNKPGGIDVDSRYNVYINDIANNVVRKVDTKGIITPYAGNGEYGFSGDGCNANNASFSEIYGICIDHRNDDLYLADYFNHRVRVVDGKTKIISTLIGNGVAGYNGDGGNPLDACLNRQVALCVDEEGNVYVAESGNSCIRLFNHSKNKLFTLVGSGNSGIGNVDSGNRFCFSNPNGLAIKDNCEIIVLDGSNNRVCKITKEEV